MNYCIYTVYSSSCNSKKDYSGHFGDFDLNGDDQLSWEEFKKHFKDAEEHVFKEADENKNGSVDHDEWHEFKENHGYEHKE